MRNAAYLMVGFSLLVVQATLGALAPFGVFVPNPILPLVLYLGVTPDVHVVRGAAISFALGYLLDSFCGSPMGLSTFVMVATFLGTRGAGLNLFMRGSLFQILLTFGFGMLTGGAVLALRAIFEPPAPFPADSVTDTAVSLVAGSAVTALLSPIIFLGIRRVDALVTRRREEAAPV